MPTPSLRSPSFASQSGTGALSISPAATGYQQDDLMVLFVESENQDITTPSGWTQISTFQGTATAGASTAARLEIFYKFASASEGNISVADSGDHTSAVLAVFKDVDLTNPIDSSAGDTGSSSTAVTIPSITTTVANCLVIDAVAGSADTTTGQASGWTNANLSSLGEIFDVYTTQADGGGISVATGIKATAGSTGTTTATLAAASLQARIKFALTPRTIYRSVGAASGVGTAVGKAPSTRFYLNTVVKQIALPAPDSSWEKTDNTFSTYPLMLTTGKGGGSGIVGAPADGVTSGTPYDSLAATFISEPLDAQTITGTLRGYLQGSTSMAGQFTALQGVLRVISYDGSTVRGTLRASGSTGYSAAIPPGLPISGTQATSRKVFPTSPDTLSSLSIQYGDRLMFEVGVRQPNGNGSAPSNIVMIGSKADGTNPDVPENETTTTTYAASYDPWIEFNTVLKFASQQSSAHSAGSGNNYDFSADFTGTAWSNTGNITASDNAYSTCIIPAGSFSQYLAASNFGLAIPAGALIAGVEFEFEHKVDAGSGEISYNNICVVPDITLAAASNTMTGIGAYQDNTGSANYNITTSDINWVANPGGLNPYLDYDTSSSQLVFTPAMLNSPNFGILYGVGNGAGVTRTVSVDNVLVRVYYYLSPGSVGEASGLAVATGVGRSAKKAVGASAGIGAATSVGRKLAAALGSASGIGAAAAAGRAARKAVGSSTGASTAAAAGRLAKAAAGSSTGASTVAAASRSLNKSTATTAGLSAVSAVGRSLKKSVANTAGLASASAVGKATKRAVASVTGLASVLAVGKAGKLTVGSSTGTSTVAAVGKTAKKGVGSSTGTSTAAAASRAVARMSFNISGTSNVLGRSKFVWNKPVPITNFTLKSGANRFGYSVITFSGEPVPIEHMTDAQKLDNADAYVELFQIILSDKQTKIYMKLNHDVDWQGNTYEGTGIKLDGVGKYADDQVARPKLTLFNPEGVYSYLIDQGLLDGATIVRYRVLLDDVENDRPIYRRQQWKVSRVASVKIGYIGLELRDMMDGQNFTTPARMFIPPDFPTVSLS